MGWMLAIAVLMADDRFVITEEFSPSRKIEATWNLDAAAVAKLANSQGTTPAAVVPVIDAYCPTWCAYCKQWAMGLVNAGLLDSFTDGAIATDGQFAIRIRIADHPHGTSYPFFLRTTDNVFKRDNGNREWGQLRQWCGLSASTPPNIIGPLPTTDAPQAIGSATIKTYLDSLLSTFRTFGGDKSELTLTHTGKGWVELGPLSVLIPTGCKASIATDTRSARLTFSGTKPRVRLYALDQPISGVIYDGAKLRLDFDSWVFPDAEVIVK